MESIYSVRVCIARVGSWLRSCRTLAAHVLVAPYREVRIDKKLGRSRLYRYKAPDVERKKLANV